MERKLLVASLLAYLGSAFSSPLVDVRITGGNDALPNQFPYQAAIYIYASEIIEPLADEFCSGSLISPSYILTSARAQNSTIILGGPDLDNLEPQQIKVASRNFIIPETYVSGRYDWDIGLIKLDAPVELSDNIQPIKLADIEENYAGDIATVAGWGATYAAQFTVEPVLKWIESVIISYRQCIKYNPWAEENFAEESHICQYTGYPYKSACRGDTGAPLTLDGIQIGLVSSTPANCFRGHPVIHTKVSKYIDWIREHSDI